MGGNRESKSPTKRGLSGMIAGQTKPQGAFTQYATQAERVQSAAGPKQKQNLNQSATNFYGQNSAPKNREARNQRTLNSQCSTGDRSYSNDNAAIVNALNKHRSQTGTLYGIVSNQNKKKEYGPKGIMTPTLQHRTSNGSQRSGYNGEQTHMRQIKSGLDISDPQNLVK